MFQGRTRWRRGLVQLGTLLVLGAGLFALERGGWFALWGKPRPLHERMTTVPVRRTDLHVSTTAGGRLESASSTVIECELESLEIGVKGQRLAAGGSSTILSLVPEGTMVRKDDVICVLDASDYEELVRQQRMTVETARADHRQAELNLEVAKLGVKEFRDGYMPQDLKQMRGAIAQALSDWERATDRLQWTLRMKEKGYAPAAQVSSDRVAVRRAELALSQGRMALDVYQRFTASKTVRELESQVSAAEFQLAYEQQRLRLNEERLENLERQVEACTIKAPHDGFLIYANDVRHNIIIEPGIAVHLRQKLFYLPDLAHMEVVTMVHESVINQVAAGQRAKVRVEALPNRELEGRVLSVEHLPTPDRRSNVPYFVSLVELDSTPKGLRPGMTAEVEIQTTRRDHVLAIPPEALTVEDGQDVCYVAHDEGVERREVKVGQATRDLLEVTEGLEEGEEVVLDPSRSGAAAEAVAAAPAEHDSGVEPEPGQ